jgi:8-oxo-dGTP pyrophosphatase MutT (NUDIX family)
VSTADAPAAVPEWLQPLVDVAGRIQPGDLTRFTPPPGAQRRSAVLVLFGDGEAGPDVLLIERAHDMRSHAGQPAFPGGVVDETDVDAVATALREAAEETGLLSAGVDVLHVLPDLYLPPSDFVVTPVLAYWRAPSPVAPGDPAEVASVHRVPLAQLADPAHRVRVQHPSGYVGPGFEVSNLLVWGFTGGLLERLLILGGLAQPYEPTRLVPLL